MTTHSAHPLSARSLCLVAFVIVTSARAGWAENGRVFEKQLQAPFHASLSGQSLRGMLEAVQTATGVSYWLDRRVDPDQPMEPVTAGPRVEPAYHAIGRAAGLATLPLDGIVLVGRIAWVDRIGAAWLSSRDRGRRSEITRPIRWPRLTTPDEALRATTAAARLTPDDVQLPHDLWPEFEVDSTLPSTVLLLIGAQFDRWLRPDLQGAVQTLPLPATSTIRRRYPGKLATPGLRAEAEQLDPHLQWSEEEEQLLVAANARVHRRINIVLQQADAAGGGGAKPRGRPPRNRPATSPATFQFQLKNAPVGAALATLAKSAGWQLRITEQAETKCQQRITLENADDASLEEWVHRIVDQVGLTATRQGDVLQIEAR